MNKEQLQIVQRIFGAFGWPDEDQGAAIEIDGEYITIGNGLLRIRAGHSQEPAFKLEIRHGDTDLQETVHIAWWQVYRTHPLIGAWGSSLPEIVVCAVAAYAEHKAQGIIDDLATEAAVKEYDEWELL